jgi:hypothetical protein
MHAAVGCGGGASFGTVEFGELVYSGTVDGNYLSRQLLQLDPPFEACYVRVKRRARTTEGVINLTLRGSAGRLVGEITSNSTGSSELGECILGAISGLTINEPENSAPWDYTADWSVSFELARLDRSTN